MARFEISNFLQYALDTKGKSQNVNDLLQLAVEEFFSPEVMEYLIEQGGDINFNQGELLSLAVRMKNYLAVEYIITNPEFTVDYSIVNIVMQTLLNDDTKLFQWFLKQKKFIPEQYLRDTVKHSITVFVIRKDFDTIQLIYDQLGPLNYILEDAVINSVVMDYADVLQFLYEKGANVRFADDFPLVLACTNGKLSIAKVLVSIGADIHAQNDLAFRMSLSSGNLELVKFLLNNGADPTMNDEESIRIAESQFNLQLIDILLKHGCTGKNITWTTAKKFMHLLNKNQAKVKIDAVNKIGTWWIPICYDLTRECGKRMMENSWRKISDMYDNFLSS